MSADSPSNSRIVQGTARTDPTHRQKSISIVALLGTLGVSAGILTLASEEYWIFYEPIGTAQFLTVEYRLECLGYGFLGLGVLVLGISWTLARVPDGKATLTQSVFDRYDTNWGVRIGTIGYLVVVIGLLINFFGDAGQLLHFTIITWPIYYPLSDFVSGIGLAVWAIGAYLHRVSPSLERR